MTRQQKAVLIIIGVLLIGGPFVVWGITSISNSITSSGVVVDRDTGEKFDKKVGTVQTGGAGVETGSVVLFGIEPIIKELYAEGESTAFMRSVRSALWDFSDTRLDNKHETITLRPQGLVIGSSEITGTIRLGQTDEVLPISIKPSTTNEQAVVTINEGGGLYKGAYVYVGGIDKPGNLLFTITQKNDHVSDLEVKTYGGYRELALKYIESIGYNVPDFVINFSNYENPFK